MSMSSSSELDQEYAGPSLWLTLVTCAAAGGMGWGIRGQYGHETGAMIAGVLVGSVIALLYCSHTSSLHAARVAALGAIGISFGGSMTYGQTVGLTHDAELHGNWAALGWGMLGLFIKGGIWIGLAGGMMGIGLSGKKYTTLEITLLLCVMIGLMFVGVYVLNEPYSPGDGLLPQLYFSDHPFWEPDKLDMKSRHEVWGGLAVALGGLMFYTSCCRRDMIASSLALFGIIFGGLGFAGGQCLQAYHAWNLPSFASGPFAQIDPYMNWWNMMETTFGAVMGAGLGLGVWCNRRAILAADAEDEVELRPAVELVLLTTYLACIVGSEFISFRPLETFADHALTMGVLPLAAIIGGRWSPYLIALPLVAVPIAGKTFTQLSYNTDLIPVEQGWLYLLAIPLVVLTVAAVFFARGSQWRQSAGVFTRAALLLNAWVYFWLNFAFFEFPWLWEAPTSRTPSAAIFTVCAVLLTLVALTFRTKTLPKITTQDETAAIPIWEVLE